MSSVLLNAYTTDSALTDYVNAHPIINFICTWGAAVAQRETERKFKVYSSPQANFIKSFWYF